MIKSICLEQPPDPDRTMIAGALVVDVGEIDPRTA